MLSPSQITGPSGIKELSRTEESQSYNLHDDKGWTNSNSLHDDFSGRTASQQIGECHAFPHYIFPGRNRMRRMKSSSSKLISATGLDMDVQYVDESKIWSGGIYLGGKERTSDRRKITSQGRQLTILVRPYFDHPV